MGMGGSISGAVATPRPVTSAAVPRLVDVNLPHARTIANRLVGALEAEGILDGDDGADLYDLIRALSSLLSAFPEDPAERVAAAVAGAAASLAREIVARLRSAEIADPQLGRHVRNLFECLGYPEEGAELALEVGEDPASPLRPLPAN